MNALLNDLRYALRMLAKNPGFTAVAVLTLALGIGANTAIFTVVDALLFRPLPFRDPAQIVEVMWAHPSGRSFMPRLRPEMFEEWRSHNEIFAQIEPYSPRSYVTTSGPEPQRVMACQISAGLFPMLGVPPALGRAFAAEEVEADAKVVILS